MGSRNVPKTTAASAAHLDSSPLLTGRSVLNQQTSLWRAQRVAGPWRVLQLGLLVSSCVSESYKESAHLGLLVSSCVSESKTQDERSSGQVDDLFRSARVE